MDPSYSSNEFQDIDDFEDLGGISLSSPSDGPPSTPSRPQTPRSWKDLPSRPQTPRTWRDPTPNTSEDENEPTALLSSQNENAEKKPREMRSSTGEADTEEQAPNPPPPHYEGSRQIFRGVVAWWGKLAGKGQVTERGPQLSFAMVTVKLSDIKPLYGALCPGSYVVYQKDFQGLFNFWVEAGPYVLYEEAHNNLTKCPCFREENYKLGLEWLEFQGKDYPRAQFLEALEMKRNPYLSG